MFKVVSSQISSVGYDRDTKTMYVEFSNGTVYTYDEVPQNVFENMKNSNSAGRFFMTSIKGYFDYSKTDLEVEKGIINLNIHQRK